MASGTNVTRRRGATAVLLATAVLAVTVGFPATADPVPSAAKLKEAEARAEQLDSLVTSAEAELAAIEQDLVALATEMAVAQQELDVATSVFTVADQAATAAADRHQQARQALREAEAELRANQATLGKLARDTYKYGLPASSPVVAVLGSAGSDDGDLADRLHYLQRGIGVRAVALERSEALSIEVEHLTMRADDEAAQAKEALATAEAARDDAARLHARVADLTSATSDKLERSLQLVAVLESEQDEVATRIETLEERVAEEIAEKERREREERERREREERERQEREARERQDREARERQDREARERAERERRERDAAQQRSAASSSQPSPPASKPSSGSGSGSGGTSIRPGPNPNLVTVGGITVAASLGPQLQALLDHARSDGIVLGGHGYRSPEVTARLRIANGCPDVYDSPASSCRVPTARPGTSEHEKGLAVDFTWQGQTICFPRPGSQCHGNAAYNWLRANASRYGLKNLASEAWHWSTTGR